MTLQNGREAMKEATVVSTGPAKAGEIIALDSSDRIDVTVLPVGVGPDVATLLTTEALNAGDYVNIFNDVGVPKVRKADATNDRPAHGFVKDPFALSSNAVVFFEGPNDDRSGLTPGARYYLSSGGGVTSTPPSLPTSVIHQFLGIAVNATTINTDIADEVVL